MPLSKRSTHSDVRVSQDNEGTKRRLFEELSESLRQENIPACERALVSYRKAIAEHKSASREESPKKRTKLERNAIVALNDLDLTRGTEQTAILMSLACGRGIKSPGSSQKQNSAGSSSRAGKTTRTLERATVVRMALQASLGYLSEAYCRGRVCHRDPRDFESPTAIKLWKRLWHPEADGRFGHLKASEHPQYELDFVVSPADGVRDLIAGRDGPSISVIAGGPPGSFLKTDSGDPDGMNLPDRYFVVGCGPRIANMGQILPNEVNKTRDAVLFADVILQEGLVERIATYASKNRAEVTLATVGIAHSRPINALLSKRTRLRTFQGSSVAALITTFFERFGIDAFLGIVRRTHVLLAATAARATGGALYAVAVYPPTAKDKQAATARFIKPYERVHDAGYFVTGENVFLVATAITEGLILEGVRFQSDNQVSTQTLVLSSRSKSKRFIAHHHDLREKQFFLLGETKFYHDIVKNFIKTGRF